MDLLAHMLYGATLCSRRGWAGGRKVPAGTWMTDWTVWYSVGFSVLPDALSMGTAFLGFWVSGVDGNYFHAMDGGGIVAYRYMHSLVVSVGVAVLLGLARRALLVPSLAWTVHVLMDSVTHGTGKFQTTLIYPLSDWHIDGVRWWEHPGAMLTYWATLPLIWAATAMWRRGGRTSVSAGDQ